MAGENGARARKGRLALTPAVVPGNAGNPRRQTGLRYRILAWARSLAPLRILPDWKVVANPFFETQLQTVWVSLGKQTRTLYPLVKKPVGDRDRKSARHHDQARHCPLHAPPFGLLAPSIWTRRWRHS
jgi:hypothetical protein